MPRIVAIVEGHGEVEALPILLRRICEQVSPGTFLEVPRPIRTKRQLFLKAGELERAVELAARQAGPEGKILILLDADDDCPKHLAPQILARATAARNDRDIRVVLAKVEYEAWFIAAIQSLAGHRDIAVGVMPPLDPESIGDAKGWLSSQMPIGRSYRETLDQPALSASVDLTLARNAPSFDKFWRDVESLL